MSLFVGHGYIRQPSKCFTKEPTSAACSLSLSLSLPLLLASHTNWPLTIINVDHRRVPSSSFILFPEATVRVKACFLQENTKTSPTPPATAVDRHSHDHCRHSPYIHSITFTSGNGVALAHIITKTSLLKSTATTK